MKNEKIAKDLLNLYAEDLLSDESKEFVEENLKESEDLRNDLDEIKKDKLDIKSNNERPLNFLNEAIRRDKKSFTIMVASLAISLVFIIISLFTSPIHYNDDGKLFSLTETDDLIFITFNKNIKNVDTFIDSGEFGNEKNLFLDAYTSRFEEIKNKDVKTYKKQAISIKKENYDNIYYQNNGDLASLVYGNGSENVAILPRLSLSYYFLLIAILSLGFVILSYFLKKLKPYRKYVSILPITYFLAMILINGFSFETYYLNVDFAYIALTWIFISIAIISSMKLWENKRKI